MKKKLCIWGIVLLVLMAGLNVGKVLCKNNQASCAFVLSAIMQGEYKIGDGEWKPIVQGEHIPACQGDIVLRGQLLMAFPDGEIVGPVEQNQPVTLFFNHLGGGLYINGEQVGVFDAENEYIGNSACGEQWITIAYPGMETDVVEFHLTNPHVYGNEFAVDEFLSSMIMSEGLQPGSMLNGKTENVKIMGFAILFVALLIMGVALFSSMIRLDLSKIMWLVGTVILFAGIFFWAKGTSSYSGSMKVAMRTAIIVLSMMMYGFGIQALISVCFESPMKKIGYGTVAVSGVLTGGLLAYALVTNVKLYDVLAVWVVVQTVTSFVLLIASFVNIKYVNGLARWVQVVFIVSLIVMILDIIATKVGWWQGAYCSAVAFVIQFFAALFTVLRVFPKSIKATIREKEIKAELEKSKTAVMLSQIQPHFLYNSLGAIRELCHQDPEEARNALGTFITYLRGNMDSIQREHTIHFSKELNHISSYLELEKMRFGDDLNIVFDIQETDFYIPSLTIQPLVENAVKHGVCGREEGGTVTLHTHREGDNVIVQIKDDGVGFDVNDLDKTEHVGLKYVRNRLEYIVNGKLEIDSELGSGTIATITINSGKDWER